MISKAFLIIIINIKSTVNSNGLIRINQNLRPGGRGEVS